jgi:V8-like Glu-specific endopeptidase
LTIKQQLDPMRTQLWSSPDEALDRALVGPVDNRVHELHTRRFPYRTVCHLGRDFGDGKWRGCSGVLIGPTKVLTAGHCLFSTRRRRPPLRVRVAPGRFDRDTFPYGTLISREYYVPYRFARPMTVQDRKLFDYGLIILPEPFSDIRRFMRVRALPSSDLRPEDRQRRVTIAGYPGDRPVGTLWHHSENIHKVTPRRLLYSVDTCPGHSGSPVWLAGSQGRQPVIVGIHTSGIVDELGRSYGCGKGVVLAPPGMLNSGVRVTPEVLANLRDPRRSAKGYRPMLRLP